MTDRLIRIGSGTFCQVRHLQPGDVIKLLGREYTVERLVWTVGGDIQIITTPGSPLWAIKAWTEVTVVRAQEGA
jgi:hypothetical protein